MYYCKGYATNTKRFPLGRLGVPWSFSCVKDEPSAEQEDAYDEVLLLTQRTDAVSFAMLLRSVAGGILWWFRFRIRGKLCTQRGAGPNAWEVLCKSLNSCFYDGIAMICTTLRQTFGFLPQFTQRCSDSHGFCCKNSDGASAAAVTADAEPHVKLTSWPMAQTGSTEPLHSLHRLSTYLGIIFL